LVSPQPRGERNGEPVRLAIEERTRSHATPREPLGPNFRKRASVSAATTEAVVAGLLIAGFGLSLAVAESAPHYVDYVLALFGIWSAVAPFVFEYSALPAAFYSDLIVGVVVFLAAIVSIYYRSHHGAFRPRTA
jgi:hypothetical protein